MEGTGTGMFVVRMFWHWRRYGAARMLINDEDPDNMQRHDSVKPVGCCFLCILIDPSLLFNMTAAPRATIRPCLCYLLFRAPRVTVPCYSLFVEMFPFPPPSSPVHPTLYTPPRRAVCLALRRILARLCTNIRKVFESKGDFERIYEARIVLFA